VHDPDFDEDDDVLEEPWEIGGGVMPDITPSDEAAADPEAGIPGAISNRILKLEVPLKDVPLLFRLCHAMCYYTSQGRTFRDIDVFLCDADGMRGDYGKRALIVGLSRATHSDFVHVVGDQEAFLDDLALRASMPPVSPINDIRRGRCPDSTA
jgi:hypothetical protein